MVSGAKRARTADLLHAMERLLGRSGSLRSRLPASELLIRPPEAISVQRGSARMVTSLVTSRTGSCYGSNTVSSCRHRPAGVLSQRTISRLPRRSPQCGELLAWTCGSAHPLADPPEPLADLPPGTVTAGRGDPLRDRPIGRLLAPPVAQMLAVGANASKRSNHSAQCTPPRARHSATPHPPTRHLWAPTGTTDHRTLEIVEAGR